MKSDQIEKKILHFLSLGLSASGAFEDRFLAEGQRVPRTTLVRALNRLLEEKLIEFEGEGRGRQYRLARVPSNGLEREETAHVSKKIPFDRKRIDNYQPNESRWLGAEQLRQLHKFEPSVLDAGTYVKSISRRFLVDLSYASSALEGNTYSWPETRDLLEGGIVSKGKNPFETLMIENHGRAAQYVIDLAADKSPHGVNLDRRLVSDIHALLSDGLVDYRGRGAIRHSPVAIGNSSYQPESAPQVLKECLDTVCEKANEIDDPFEKSLFVLATISYLQPFIDVNKRTGRLLVNVCLLSHGYVPLSFLGTNKEAYISSLLQFYETGNTKSIASVFTESWLERAPYYQGIQEITPEDRAILVRWRGRMRKTIAGIGRGDVNVDRIGEAINDIPLDERPLVEKNILSYIKNTDPDIFRLDGYSSAEIKELMAIRRKMNAHDNEWRRHGAEGTAKKRNFLKP